MEAADGACIILPSRPSALADARRFVDEQAARAGFSDPDREEISLAVTEAVSNAIRYGSPAGEADSVELCVAVDEAEMVITVRDHGSGFAPPPPSLPDPAQYAEHGRGLFLMHCLMDAIRFDRDDGTVVRMTKKR